MNKFENEEVLLKSIAHINAIFNSTNSKELKNIMNDYEKLDSVLFQLIQIGELTTKFTTDFKNEHKNIDFVNIKGLRNIVVHDYDGVEYDEIIDIIKEELPELNQQYIDILTNEYNITKNYINEYINYFLKTRKFLENS